MTRVAGAVRRARRAGSVAPAAAAALLVALAAPSATAADRAGAKGPSLDQVYKRVARAAFGPGGVEVDVILASPDYLRITNQTDAAAQYQPRRNFLFFIVEHKHDGSLGPAVRPLLRVDGGRPRPPARAVVTLTGSHHRARVLVYPRAAHWHVLEILLPPPRAGRAATVLKWTLADEAGER